MIFHCLEILHSVYPFINWQTSHGHILCEKVFKPLGYIPHRGITGSFGNSVSRTHPLFSKASTAFYIPTSSDESSSSSSSSLPTGMVSPHILAILVDVRWDHMVVLICIFLRIYDVEHLFMWLFGLCISSLLKCLLRFFPHF